MENATDFEQLELEVDETGQLAQDLLERAETALTKAVEMIAQFDEEVERNRIYREAFDVMRFLFFTPGPVKKADVKAVLNELQKRITTSYMRELKKLAPEWNGELDDGPSNVRLDDESTKG